MHEVQEVVTTKSSYQRSSKNFIIGQINNLVHYLKNSCTDWLSNTKRPERPQKTSQEHSRGGRHIIVRIHNQDTVHECKYRVFRCKPLLKLKNKKA